MATISLALVAINKASGPISDVAAAAQAAADRIDALNTQLDQLNTALGAQTAAASAAASQLTDLAGAAEKAAAAQTAAAAANAASAATSNAAADSTAKNLTGLAALQGALLGTVSLLNAGGGGWRGWTGGITLFGGALNGILPAFLTAISYWHLAAEATIEFGTTLLEATAGLLSFAAFAAPTFQHIYVRLSNIWTASNALNSAIYPLSTSMFNLNKAVAPEAYELFGEAIEVATKNTGVFSKTAAAAGQVLDQLGGRFVAAVDNGNSMSTFLQDSGRSLDQWGTIIGNVGGTIGAVFKVLPGYADIVTHSFEDITGAMEAVANSPIGEFLIGLGLKLHGAIVWIGLAVTATVALVAAFAGLGVGALISNLFGLALAFQGVAASEGILVATTDLLMRVSPMGWALLAIGALTGLIVLIAGARNETDAFAASLEQLVQNSPINEVGTALTNALQQTRAEMDQDAASAGKLAAQYKTVDTAVGGAASRFQSSYNPQLDQAVNKTQTASASLTAFQQQADLVNSRVAALSKEYGGNAAAMGLMIQAGITSAQITDKNTEAWRAAEAQIQAVADANNAMALGTGRSAAAMNALNYAGDTTNNVLGSLDVDMQKVVTGMGDITSVVLGAEQALGSYESGLETFQTDAQATGASLNSMVTSTGALNAASVTLSQDYYSTMLPAMQSTINAMELQLPTTKQLTGATADMAQQLLPVASGNQAAEASLITLINNALGPGTVSFKNLAGWISQNAGGLSQLNNIIGETTTQASVLANTLGSDLNASFAKDLLSTTGAQQALAQYTSDLVNNTYNTAAGQADRLTLINDLINSGLSAQQAANYVNDLTTQLGKVPSSVTTTIKVVGVEQGSLQALDLVAGMGGITQSASIVSSGGIAQLKAAAGGYISGPGTRTSDSVPALLSAGEYVVRADSVDRYGKQMMDLINAGRYAAGGLVRQATTLDLVAAMSRRPVRLAQGGAVAETPFAPASTMYSAATTPISVGMGSGGPLIHIDELYVRSDSDVTMIAQRLSNMIVAASMAAGVR